MAGLLVCASQGLADVTAQNLFASERFWPYYVALTDPWAPPGHAPLAPGLNAVLIRVEANGLARVDFGRDGLHEVPVAATDLIARANRIRSGELEKAAPNFTFSIGPRLVDSAQPLPAGLPPAALARARVFVCLFANPADRGFRALVRSIAKRAIRSDEAVLLFPQGNLPDAETSQRLRSLGWAVPYLWDHLSEPYTATLLAREAPLPRWLLVSAEGRVIDESPWTRASLDRLESALEAERIAAERQQAGASAAR